MSAPYRREGAKIREDKMRRHHDMGGLDAGPVQREDHVHQPWEKQVTAIVRLLNQHNPSLMAVDEMRRNIEDLGPGNYDALGYYERWINAVSRVLLQKGIVSVDELGTKMADVKNRLITRDVQTDTELPKP